MSIEGFQKRLVYVEETSVKELAGDSDDFDELRAKAEWANAQYMDLNMGALSRERVIKAVRAVPDYLHPWIDSDNPSTLEAGLMACNEGVVPTLNSATESRADAVFSLRDKRECLVVLLIYDEDGSYATSDYKGEQAFEHAKALFKKARERFEPHQIYIDPALLPIGSYIPGMGFDKALYLIEHVNSDPEIEAHTVVGLTNLTKELPKNVDKLSLQNAFLVLARERGLDTVIAPSSANYQRMPANSPYVAGLRAVVEAKGFDAKIDAFTKQINPLIIKR